MTGSSGGARRARTKLTTYGTRQLERLLRLLRRPRPPRAQAIVGIVAVALLVAGTVAAVQSLPDDVELRWWPFAVLVLVGTPWSIFLLSTEVGLLGRLAGQELPTTTKVRIAILGTAFNLLPIPGAAVTRLDALVAAGARVRRATGAIVVIGVVWVAVSLVIAGVALIGITWAAALFLLGGLIATTAAGGLMTRSLPQAGAADLARIVGLETLFTVTTAARFALALAVLDEGAPFRGALVMAASAALSTAAGVAPGGLGIREGLATLFGDLAGIPASVALLAALVDRAAALLGVLASSLVVLPRAHRREHR